MNTQFARDWHGSGKAIAKAALLFFIFSSHNSFAAFGRADYDLDNDGLIEINDLADLSEIRNNLDGTSLYAVNTGCPVNGCTGFELTTDLDFDTNQDGKMGVDDAYWNANEEGVGQGWLPLGDSDNAFTSTFEGRGHVIKNLYINRADTNNIGLFGYANQSNINQLVLSGPLMSITGRFYVGALVGNLVADNLLNGSSATGSVNGEYSVGALVGIAARHNQLTGNYSSGSVQGSGAVGGLVGYVDSNNLIASSFSNGAVHGKSMSVGGLVGNVRSNNQITASFSSGFVSGESEVGGLLGSVFVENQISNSFSSGFVVADSSAGGLIGSYLVSSNIIKNSYWVIDASGQLLSSGSSEDNSYLGLTLSTLQCAIQANTNASNSSCVTADGVAEAPSMGITLFKEWHAPDVWDFGNNQQLPGLILSGVVHRDSDGDGTLDESDAFPNQHAASVDADQDGHPDVWTMGCDAVCRTASELTLDQFPLHAAGWKDSDLDGLVDEWPQGCDDQCQADSGLLIDPFAADSDNDGVSNADDHDDNGDGMVDIDADSDGLIDVTNLLQLNAMRHQLNGQGYRGSSEAELNLSGCPFIVYQAVYQQRCLGYELITDLDFDTNQDGQMDSEDTYWNSSEGWLPVGDTFEAFSSIFDGNGHTIRNLYINRAQSDDIGLFGLIDQAQIRQLGLDGPLMSITGGDAVGALAGYVKSASRIIDSYSTGPVKGDHPVGGLLGLMLNDNQITNSYSTADVHGAYYVGGLVGSVYSNNIITASHSTGSVGGGTLVGGLVGNVYSYNQFTASYTTGSVSGGSYVGGLLGKIDSNNQVTASFSVSQVLGSSYEVGGLVGSIGSNNQIMATYSTGSVQGPTSLGGLVGYNSHDNQITASFSTGFVSGDGNVGGFLGSSNSASDPIIENSYWGVDSSGQLTSSLSSESQHPENSGYVGLTLASLQCATQANTDAYNSSCVSSDGSVEGLNSALILYKDWQAFGFWDFGSDQQLPGLNLSGVVHRDSDGDGSLDEDDVWPYVSAASKDDDQDGAPDVWRIGCDTQCRLASGLMLDQFLSNAAGWKDTDLDGLVDEWASGCTGQCQADSGLSLDPFVDDSDNDGISNTDDNDDNNDGLIDVDADSDGLIDITNLAQLNAMRYQLNGAGSRVSAQAELDQSGCPYVLYEGVYQQHCSGYELTENLNFDTNSDGQMDVNDAYWNGGEGWLPVGDINNYFTATFEGNDHVIENLFIDRSNRHSIGLFGYIDQARIQQLGLSGPLMSITGGAYTGSLVGYVKSNSIIIGSFNTGSINGREHVGGLLGYVKSNNQITDSYSSGAVQGSSDYVGGLVGSTASYNQITGSHSTGDVQGSADYVGGLLGGVEGHNRITASYSLGDVVGADSYVGGLVGFVSYNNQITTSYSLGAVRGARHVGGLVGFTSNDNHITACFSQGAVSGDSSIGGLAGFVYANNQITASYSTGSVQGSSAVGGLLGSVNSNNQITASFSSGLVSGDLEVGGLIGKFYDGAKPSVKNSYWAVDSSGQSSSALSSEITGYVGLTVATLQCAIQANTDASNSSCVSSNGSGEGLSAGLTLYKKWDILGLWEFGGNQHLPSFNLSGAIHRDSDGDGVLDIDDQYPFDSDKDGVNNFNDVFPGNFAASVDDDQDGKPDVWAVSCKTLCQLASGLELDSLLNDTDNDGVINDDDTDNSADNGAPELNQIADDIFVTVNSEDGKTATLTWDDNFFAQFDGYDVVDAYNLEFEASLDGEVIALDNDENINFPAGRFEVEWIAKDIAGNTSNTLIQAINVYPQVRFAMAQSISGDQSIAEIKVELSGESPVYPVEIEWQVNQSLSSNDLTQEDVHSDFDINGIHKIIIGVGFDPEVANTQGYLWIPISENDDSEFDENMVLDLIGVIVEEGKENFYQLDLQRNQHTLTLAYQNLAPSVQFLLEQNGKKVTQVEQDGGLVFITALVSDGDDLDVHTFQWELHELGLEAPSGRVLMFNPEDFPVGDYSIQVIVTDSGDNNLSASAEMDISIALSEPVNSGGGGGGGGGGGTLGLLVLLLAGFIMSRRPVVDDLLRS